jgi:hypothetical protein
MHGPFVLGAETGHKDLDGLIADDSRMGHVAHGPLYPLEGAPMLQINDENWTEKVVPVKGKTMTFKAPDLIVPDSCDDLEFMPFFQIHNARYMVYWRTGSSDEIDSIRRAVARHDKELLALEKKTIDRVAPGEQQPETEHNFKGEETRTGVHEDRHRREATGWFSYDLKDSKQEAKTLRITYWDEDTDRKFKILINETELASVKLSGGGSKQFVDVDYPIPASLVQSGNGVLTVRFIADEGSVAGGIYYIRLMRE